MRDGVFLMSYSSLGLPGWCTLTLDRGVAYGFDMAGGMYDGTYAFDPERRVADVELAVTVPPNVATLWGPAKPYTWSFAVTAAFDPNADEGLSRLTNTLGVPDADVAYRFIRPLPARGIFADGDMSFRRYDDAEPPSRVHRFWPQCARVIKRYNKLARKTK